ncbi:tetratricopeptide repeat protein [Novosphingobium lentum]|uniref:tetratricopeptide repeat protein n=1 Tax=Novosphingobium lentum TaxID=145287 RepID=UPI000A059912|nr:tetratricopeptide repeat protein [Novosphingobium lentum]
MTEANPSPEPDATTPASPSHDASPTDSPAAASIPAPEPADVAKASRIGRIALIGAGVLALGAGTVAMVRSQKDVQVAPPVATASQAQPSVDDVIAKLEAKLKDNPDDAEGWRMLGWSYFQTERYAESATALKHATKLDPKNAETYSFLGEALVLASKEEGKIPGDAQAAFARAIAIDPKDARARYFRAVALDLAGQHRAAIEAWFALLKDTPGDAPYANDVRDVIRTVGKKNKIEVEKRLAEAQFAAPKNGMVTNGPDKVAAAIPGPNSEEMKAASQLPSGQQEAMIRGMVDGLQTKLEANPQNAQGWIMLMRSRMQLGEQAKAAKALKDGLAAFRNDGAASRQLREAAATVGVPGA